MHGFILVIKLIIGALRALTLRETNILVLVEVYGANIVLIFLVIIKINAGFAKGHMVFSF